jgi:Do/DeqQ family serine protease
MGKRQFVLGIIFASFLGGVIAIGGYKIVADNDPPPYENFEEGQNIMFSNYADDTEETPNVIVPDGLNFVTAAKIATPGVVHIKSIYGNDDESASNSSIYDFFGFGNPESRRSRATGSGVIISHDGYIVTNNHVVENANEVEVTLNSNEKFKAEIIGTDPTTDLALIKVEGERLPFLKFGDSENLDIGEWVLAVGNPFDLTSTVTAGIVSAKGRNINILRDPNGRQIESFIQTDAVVNPGNSGGALVDLNGALVGINTAIASPTGSYTGYSFAVPVTLVKKVMNDLRNYGAVQRAVLGVGIADVDDPRIGEDLGVLKGIYITRVEAGSGADEAGIEAGDIITKINGGMVNSVAELQENVAQNQPGTKIEVTYLREGREKTVTATLKNIENTYEIIRKAAPLVIEGARFENISRNEEARLEINGGVKVTELGSGKWSETGIKKGFIITNIDRERVRNVEELEEILKTKEGSLTVLGIYPNGTKDYYSLDW